MIPDEALIRTLARLDLVLLLDHDGTLAELTAALDAARPDPGVLATLSGFVAAGVDVHVVSGRERDTLSRWYGGTGASLHAEHGAFSAGPGGGWTANGPASLGAWRAPIERLMADFATRTDGAFVEAKAAGLAWHHRAADPAAGETSARALIDGLRALLGDAPIDVLAGDKVIEARPAGVHKGRVAAAILARRPGAHAVALGDDRTDADLFAALPAESTTIAVGDRLAGRYRLPDVAGAHAFLAALLAARRTERAPRG